MRILTVESAAGVGASDALRLRDEGHEVVGCWSEDHVLCSGVDGACPIDLEPVDVALSSRRHDDGELTASELGVLCAVRRGIGVLVSGGPNPLESWATERAPGESLTDGCRRAGEDCDARRAGPLEREVERVLALHGIEDKGVRVGIEHDGRTRTVTVALTDEVDAAMANRIATRLLAVDQLHPSPDDVVSVAVTSRR